MIIKHLQILGNSHRMLGNAENDHETLETAEKTVTKYH